MSTELTCAKCGSDKVIPHARVRDRSQSIIPDLSVELDEYPNALFNKGTEFACMTARVCAGCGFTELYTDQPSRLWAIYERLRAATG